MLDLRALFCLLEVSNFPHGPWMKSSGPVFYITQEFMNSQKKQGQWEYKNLFSFLVISDI